MNESRFVELLNLYVDHELTQGEAAELDAELQRNPARREMLREYRALQRGCERLLEADRALAPRTAAADRVVLGCRRRRRGRARRDGGDGLGSLRSLWHASGDCIGRLR
jgi:anti-sigma factor RsiW